MKLVVLSISIFFGMVAHDCGAEKMGPFDTILQSFSVCPASKSGKNLVLFASRREKVSRKKFNLFLDLYLFMTVTDKYTTRCNLAKKTPQGWKENFFQLDVGPICTGMKKYVPDVFADITKGLKLKRNECPLPEGNHTNIPLRTNVDVKSLPAFFYTSLKVRCTVYEKNDVAACLEIIVDTIPKKS